MDLVYLTKNESAASVMNDHLVILNFSFKNISQLQLLNCEGSPLFLDLNWTESFVGFSQRQRV